MRRNLLVGGALLLAATAAGALLWQHFWPEETSRTSDTNAQVALGAKIYGAHCANCHGVDLKGAANWREMNEDGSLPPPPHDDSGHTWHRPDALLFKITKEGGQAVAPQDFKSGMPAFAETLSDEEIWAVLAFIKSRWSNDNRARQARISDQYKNQQ